MSSRFNGQSNNEFSGINKQKVNSKKTKKSHANFTAHISNSKISKSKNKAFALSSTAFSVCLALSSYALPVLINPAFANGPKGGVVVGGSGDISKIDAATTLINQSSQHMAINWDSYNIAANETVRYVQPNASAISLNRILGVNGSTIAGQIQSNGQVILINPNGLVFTDTSVLNVGGIIASGLDMSPTDFMNGDYIFNDLTFENGTSANGKVINRGIINAAVGGNVALIGKQVINEGLIEANLGSVTLAAGKQAVLTFDAGGVLGVRVSKEILQDELGVDPALINSGEINAKGGRVLLTASTSQDIFSQAVNSGLEQATSVVVHEDGSFTLGGGADVVNSGKIDVSSVELDSTLSNAGQIVVLGENITSSGEILANSNSFNAGEIEIHAQDTLLFTEQSLTSARSSIATGGTIKALGDKVALLNDSAMDASGDIGGGEILIGGDYRGENELIRNASASYIAGNTHINADAINEGDGGKVIIWSNDSAKVYGNISATGGLLNGNGGFVETSAEVVDLSLNVNVSANQGNSGTWLIDPFNITIDDVPNDSAIDDSQTPTAPVTDLFTNAGADSTLDIDSLYAVFTNGAHVKVETSDAGGLAEPDGGNITLATSIDIENKPEGGDVTLTLSAHHDININGVIHDSVLDVESISLVFEANSNGVSGGDVNINANIDTRGGYLEASGDNIIFSAAANVLTNGGYITLDAVNSINFDNSIINSGSGKITITDITASVDFGTSTINTGGGNLEIFDTSVGVTASGSVNFNASNISTEGGSIVVFDALDADIATGGIDFGSSTFDTAGGNVTLNSTSGIVALNSTAITTQGGSFISAASASVSTVNSSITTTGGENLDGGAINISTTGALNVDTLTADGGTTNRGGGSNTGVVGRAGGDITLLSNNSNITVNQNASAIGTTGDYRDVWYELGQNGGEGGAVALTANSGTVDTQAISTDGGAAAGDNEYSDSGWDINQANGGNAGSIILVADSALINGNYSAVGGVGVGRYFRDGSDSAGGYPSVQGVGGNGGDVSITANSATLNNDINASVGAVNEESLVGVIEGIVNINLSGSDGIATIGRNSAFTTQVNITGNNSQTLISTSTFDGLEWFIDGAGNGSWRDNSDSSALNLVFTGIENFTGGVNTDVFNITESGSILTGGIIDGGSGTNTLKRTNTTITNTWVVDGLDTGTLNTIRFNKIQTLTGSSVNDNFSFTSATASVGTVTGGTGNNSLTARDADNEWHITGDNSGVLYQDNAGAGFGTSYIDSFTDIQTLIGSNANLDNFVIDSGSSIDSIDGGSDGNNSLTGRDTDNEWDISGSNSGILYQDNAGAGFGTSYVDAFSNIQSLIGSDANLDIFVMG
ncbi:beta strand repeat-containing protein, partial [Colwellia psychrerythraea]